MYSHCWGSALHGFKGDKISAAPASEAIYIRIACLMIVFTRCMVCMKPHRQINQGLEVDVVFHCSKKLAI